MTTRENLEIEAGLLGLDLDYEPEVSIEDIESISELEWLQLRQAGIGGSDAGALLGYNKYNTAAAVLLGKKKKLTHVETKTPDKQFTLDFGHAMEAPLLKLYEGISGNKTFTDRRQFRHPYYPWMLGDCDGFAYTETGEVIGIECKTFNYDFKKSWKSGVWGQGAVVKNAEYIIQMAHYCCVLNLDRIDLVAICGNSANDIVVVTYNRDLKLEKELIEVEKKAWEDLQNGVIPEFYTLNSNQYKNLLEAITTEEEKVSEVVNLPAALIDNITEVLTLEDEKAALKKREESYEERINALKVPIIAALGNHETGVYVDESGSYQITYKCQMRKGFDQKKLEINEPEIYAKYRKETKVGPSLKIVQKRKS